MGEIFLAVWQNCGLRICSRSVITCICLHSFCLFRVRAFLQRLQAVRVRFAVASHPFVCMFTSYCCAVCLSTQRQTNKRSTVFHRSLIWSNVQIIHSLSHHPRCLCVSCCFVHFRYCSFLLYFLFLNHLSARMWILIRPILVLTCASFWFLRHFNRLFQLD